MNNRWSAGSGVMVAPLTIHFVDKIMTFFRGYKMYIFTIPEKSTIFVILLAHGTFQAVRSWKKREGSEYTTGGFRILRSQARRKFRNDFSKMYRLESRSLSTFSRNFSPFSLKNKVEEIKYIFPSVSNLWNYWKIYWNYWNKVFN